MNRLKVAYNSVIRNFFGLERVDSISIFMVENNLPVFDVLIRKYMYNFKCRIFNSENHIVKCITNWCYFIDCRLHREWTDRLYCF